jgi:hypothetical protein
MQVFAFAFLVLFASTTVISAQTTPENPKFKLVISSDKPEVILGSDIRIEITITNISEKTLEFSFTRFGNMPSGFQYDIRDEQDAEVAKFGKRYSHFSNGDTMEIPRPPGSMGWGVIKPGNSVMTSATISDDYNFDHPGKYTIRVWKPATKGTTENPELNRVYSNTITITVGAPEPEAVAPQ